MKFFKKVIDYINKLNKKSKLIILSLMIIILLILFPIIWYNSSLSAMSKDSNKVEVEIPIGSGSASIASILKKNGVIRNEFAFKMYVKLNKV